MYFFRTEYSSWASFMDVGLIYEKVVVASGPGTGGITFLFGLAVLSIERRRNPGPGIRVPDSE